MEMWEHVPLGRIYYIDISTKREVEYRHVTGVHHKKVVVKAADSQGHPDMLDLPFECLELIDEK